MNQASTPRTAQPERLLRLPDVEALVGLRKSAIYEAVKKGEFPPPVKLSRRAVCWPNSAIVQWIEDRIRAGTREAQAGRVADYLERHAASTLNEIDAVCDTGGISKVLHEMPVRFTGSK